MNLFEKVFGTHSERELKLIYPIVDKIVAMRPEMMALTDEQLRDRTGFSKSAWQTVRPWTIFFQRHSQRSARRPDEY